VTAHIDRENQALAVRSIRGSCIRGILAAGFLLTANMAVMPASAEAAQDNGMRLPPLKVEGSAPVRIGGASAKDRCASGKADCTAQKLQDAAQAAQDRAGNQPSSPSASSPDTRIGVANQTATRQRLGSNFGKSVQPQRPVPVPPAPSSFARH